jgi:hypothetical protein
MDKDFSAEVATIDVGWLGNPMVIGEDVPAGTLEPCTFLATTENRYEVPGLRIGTVQYRLDSDVHVDPPGAAVTT